VAPMNETTLLSILHLDHNRHDRMFGMWCCACSLSGPLIPMVF
jgi:hypothetical protein